MAALPPVKEDNRCQLPAAMVMSLCGSPGHYIKIAPESIPIHPHPLPATAHTGTSRMSNPATRRRAAATVAASTSPCHSPLLLLLLIATITATHAFLPSYLPTFLSPHSRSPTCLHAGGGNSLNREELRKSLVAEGVEDILAARAVEAADKALTNWEMQVLEFCRPPEVATIKRVLERVADLAITPDGGFPQAERQRVFFARTVDYELDQEQERKEREAYFISVSVEGNFIFDKASHRDFLGALLGTGITREKVGDILLQGERGAHVIVAPEVAEYVMTSLASVRSVPVKNKAIPLTDLGMRPPVTKEMQSVEASMRLDAVASAGMGMSRSKLKEMIEGGDVLVNWKETKSANSLLKGGDIVTIRGKGRLEVNEVETTSKGKFRVKMTKFI